MVLSDGEMAQQLATEALVAARSTGDLAAEVYALLTLALVKLRESSVAEGVADLRAAERLLGHVPDPRAHWLAKHVGAQLLRQQERLHEADVELSALHRHAVERPLLDAYLTVSALATVRGMQRDYEASLATSYEALTLAERTGNLSAEVNALNNLGSFQLDLYNLDDARPLLEKCLDGAQRLGSRRQTIFAAGNLVVCLCQLGEPEKALALARTHLITTIKADDPPSLHRDEEIAYVLIENELLDEARTYLARTPQLDPLTNETSAFRAWLHARLLLADDGELGARNARQALEVCLAQQTNHTDDTSVPLDRLRLAQTAAEAASYAGDYQSAYEQQRTAYEIHQRLLGRSVKARMVSLKLEMELDRTRRERDDARGLASSLEAANAELAAQIVANRAVQEELTTLALQDPLTGLNNRRYLVQAWPHLADRARRSSTGLAVVLVDLDEFKALNDRFGHDRGDLVLQRFADLVQSRIREADVCCRIGGEEFVIVFHGLGADIAVRRMEALLAEFHALPLVDDIECSFSAGVAITAVPADDQLDLLLRNADDALYRAKNLGRGRVELSGGLATSS
jgi:two-component system, cell cycle response regulator